jgi:hypothetical protein
MIFLFNIWKVQILFTRLVIREKKFQDLISQKIQMTGVI